MTGLSISNQGIGGVIDASWFGEDFRASSSTWRLMYAEEAAASGDCSCAELDPSWLFSHGWQPNAAALSASAWWLAEAIWRNGVAASVLDSAHLRRARQIGLAVLASTPVQRPVRPSAAAWSAAELFDAAARTVIRLQLPRPQGGEPVVGAHLLQQIPPVQAARLVAYARSAMGAS